MPLPRPIPQGSSEMVGIQIYDQTGGKLTDPDDSLVTLQISNITTGTIIVPAGTAATRQSTGTYGYTLTSLQSQSQGDCIVTWSYSFSGQPRFYSDPFQITPPMPYWSLLSPTTQIPDRQAVVNVYGRVENSFDSAQGGPYLAELLQSSFNAYEVIARIMFTEAITYLNFEFQPAQIQNPYDLGINAKHPFPTPLYPILEWGTYVAFLRHISRSYIEQPDPKNLSITTLNRRDYRDRWYQEWIDEKAMYDKALRQFKRSIMLGSHRSMLVAGGLIPRMFMNPARPTWMYASVSNSGGF